MAEPSAVHERRDPTPFGALLATKLDAPRLRADAIDRPRLRDVLAAGRSGVATVVTAPAGFGKTTAVAQWLAHDDAAIVWLTCDHDDDDPGRFAAYLVAALGARLPGVGREAAARLAGGGDAHLPSVLTMIVNDLRDAERVVIVLDDYHSLRHPGVHAGLSFLLDHAPPSLHVVIVGRRDPPLPLSRLRASGLLNEIGHADLRARPDESSAFLRDVMGLDLDQRAIDALEERTEGWLAGLQLAALSLRGERDAARVIEAFAGDHRHVMAYLVEEVVRGLDDDLHRFVLETSILPRLTAPLCDAVTGRADGQALLERLEREHVFTIALDDRRTAFRYHALFADAMRRRLEARPGDGARVLHARAGRWHAEHGPVSAALRHLLAADAVDEAAALVDAVALPTLEREGPAPVTM